MNSWLMLTYKIPREPSAGRVSVWRKLKRLGALALQDAVWVLPSSGRACEQLRWIAAEVRELGGEAVLWEAEQLDAGDPDALRRQFAEPVESEYRAILAELGGEAPDLRALSKRFQQAQERDHFASGLGREVRDRLLDAGGGGPS